MQAQAMKVGEVMAAITYLTQVLHGVMMMSMMFQTLAKASTSANRLREVLETDPVIKSGSVSLADKTGGTVSFKNVSFSYPETKGRPVISDLTLDIKSGESVAILGATGSGKSSLVNLIPRFYDINSGSIRIDGMDIRDLTLRSLRQNIAIVFQDNFLFSGTIRDNIMLGNENASEDDVDKAVKMAYLDDFVSGLTNGLDTQIGERGILLSGGQKQRVAIARAFLKNAPIVILDEATSALDNKAEAIVQKAIENLMQDETVFVIAHRLSTIQNADKIVVINEGEIVEIGSHEELLKIENGAYRLLYEMQFKKQSAQAVAV